MEILGIVFVLALVFIAIVLAQVRADTIKEGRKRIEAVVKQHSGTDISVHKIYAYGEQNTLQFSVSFKDAGGVQRRTRCKIEYELGRLGAIYWRNDPFTESYQARLATMLAENDELRRRLTNKSVTKEQIILELATEIKDLKAKLKQSEASTNGEQV